MFVQRMLVIQNTPNSATQVRYMEARAAISAQSRNEVHFHRAHQLMRIGCRHKRQIGADLGNKRCKPISILRERPWAVCR